MRLSDNAVDVLVWCAKLALLAAGIIYVVVNT